MSGGYEECFSAMCRRYNLMAALLCFCFFNYLKRYSFQLQPLSKVFDISGQPLIVANVSCLEVCTCPRWVTLGGQLLLLLLLSGLAVCWCGHSGPQPAATWHYRMRGGCYLESDLMHHCCSRSFKVNLNWILNGDGLTFLLKLRTEELIKNYSNLSNWHRKTYSNKRIHFKLL